MEMQINIDLVKQHRNKRAWSQTHLADASGLSLRTIQRIEKTGVGSLESIKALSAVFDIEANDLQITSNSPSSILKTKFSVLFGAITIVLCSFFAITASAQPVMVDLQLKLLQMFRS